MPRIKPMSNQDRELAKRIFFLFPQKKDEEIAEIVGSSRSVVQGWRAGKSRPTLEHLQEICNKCSVDWDWLMSGKTQSDRSISYAFFPVYEEKSSFDSQCYSKARDFAWEMLLSENRDDLGFQERCAEVVAALLYASMNKGYDPFPDAVWEEREADFDPFFAFSFDDLYEHVSCYVPDKKVCEGALCRVQGMVSCYVFSEKPQLVIGDLVGERIGHCLRLVREKIWPNPKDFMRAIGCNDLRLHEMENSGIGIGTTVLCEIAEHGGDVLFVLTGRKSPALWRDWEEFFACENDDCEQGKDSKYTLTHAEFVERISGEAADRIRELLQSPGEISHVAELKSSKAENAQLRTEVEKLRAFNDALQEEKLELREKLASLTKRASAG